MTDNFSQNMIVISSFCLYLQYYLSNLLNFVLEKGVMDKLSPEQRYRNMSAIRSKDTKPEMLVRKYLWKHGFRYRLNHGRLPGKPDMVLRKYRTCIFVNGCFWHGHNLALRELKNEIPNEDSEKIEVGNSECCKIPKSRRDFWVNKITRNKERDIEVQHKLAQMGWHCVTVWECELKPSQRETTLRSLAFTLNSIFLDNQGVKRYDFNPDSFGRIAADEGETE